jgi:hypothetical protein
VGVYAGLELFIYFIQLHCLDVVDA